MKVVAHLGERVHRRLAALENSSPAAPMGYASAPTPWAAVQFSVWQVVKREL